MNKLHPPMRLSLFLILSMTSFISIHQPSPGAVVFVASTPCDQLPRTWLGIPANADCELIKWHLTLNRDPQRHYPTSYTLRYTYGMTQTNTTGFANGGTTGQRTGTWQILPDAQQRNVYQLGLGTSGAMIRLVRLDDKLLHLLDPQGKLMIGHAGWSYTFNLN